MRRSSVARLYPVKSNPRVRRRYSRSGSSSEFWDTVQRRGRKLLEHADPLAQSTPEREISHRHMVTLVAVSAASCGRTTSVGEIERLCRFLAARVTASQQRVAD